MINDDTELLSLTAAYLSREDDRIKVLTAETAESALELFEAEPVELSPPVSPSTSRSRSVRGTHSRSLLSECLVPSRMLEARFEPESKVDSERIAPIRRSLQRMNEFTEDVLAFAREGRTVCDVASVGLADVAARA